MTRGGESGGIRRVRSIVTAAATKRRMLGLSGVAVLVVAAAVGAVSNSAEAATVALNIARLRDANVAHDAVAAKAAAMHQRAELASQAVADRLANQQTVVSMLDGKVDLAAAKDAGATLSDFAARNREAPDVPSSAVSSGDSKADMTVTTAALQGAIPMFEQSEASDSSYVQNAGELLLALDKSWSELLARLSDPAAVLATVPDASPATKDAIVTAAGRLAALADPLDDSSIGYWIVYANAVKKAAGEEQSAKEAAAARAAAEAAAAAGRARSRWPIPSGTYDGMDRTAFHSMMCNALADDAYAKWVDFSKTVVAARLNPDGSIAHDATGNPIYDPAPLPPPSVRQHMYDECMLPGPPSGH